MDSLASRTSPKPGDSPPVKTKSPAASKKGSPVPVDSVQKQMPLESGQSPPPPAPKSLVAEALVAQAPAKVPAKELAPAHLNMQFYVPGVCHDRGLDAIVCEVAKLEKRSSELLPADVLLTLPAQQQEHQFFEGMATWVKSFQLMRKYCAYLDNHPDERQWLLQPTLTTPSQLQYLHMHLEIAMVLDRLVSQLPHSYAFNQYIVGAFVLQGTGAPLEANPASQTSVGQEVLKSSLVEYVKCSLQLAHFTRVLSSSLPKDSRDMRQRYHNENAGAAASFFSQCFSYLHQMGVLQRSSVALGQLFSQEWCVKLLAELDYDTLTSQLAADSEDNIAQRCVHLIARLELVAAFEPIERAMPLLYWVKQNAKHLHPDDRAKIAGCCSRMISRYLEDVRAKQKPDRGVAVIQGMVQLCETGDWGPILGSAVQLLKNSLPEYKTKPSGTVLPQPAKPVYLSEPEGGRYWQPEKPPSHPPHPSDTEVLAWQREAFGETSEWQSTRHIDRTKAQAHVRRQDFTLLYGLSQTAKMLSARVTQGKGKMQPATETMALLFNEAATPVKGRGKKTKPTWRQQAFELNCQYQVYLEQNPIERWILQHGTYKDFQNVLEMHKFLQDFSRYYAFGVTTQRDELVKQCIHSLQAYCVRKEDKAKDNMLETMNSLLGAYFTQALTSFYLATSLRKKGESVEVKEIMPLLRDVSQSCLEGLSEVANLLGALKESKPKASERTVDGERCVDRWNTLWKSAIERVMATPLYKSRGMALAHTMPTYEDQPEKELDQWHRANEGRLLIAFLLESWCEGRPEQVLPQLNDVTPAFDRENVRAHVLSVFRETLQLYVKSVVVLHQKIPLDEDSERKSVATLRAIDHSMNYGWLGRYWFVWTAVNAQHHGKKVTSQNDLYALLGKEMGYVREVEERLRTKDEKAQVQRDAAHTAAAKEIDDMKSAPRKVKQQGASSFTPPTSDAWKPLLPKMPEPVVELSPMEKVFKPVDDLVAGNPKEAMKKAKTLIKKYGDENNVEYVSRGRLTKADAAVVLLRRALPPLSAMKKDCQTYLDALEQAILTRPHEYPAHDHYEKVMKHIHVAPVLLSNLDSCLNQCKEALDKVASLPTNFSQDVDPRVVLMVRQDCGDMKAEVDSVVGVAATLKTIIEKRAKLFKLNPPSEPLNERMRAQAKENRDAINKTSNTLAKVESKVASLLSVVDKVVKENTELEQQERLAVFTGL